MATMRMAAGAGVLAVLLGMAACGDDGDEGETSGDASGSGSGSASGPAADGSAFEGELEDGSTLRIELDVDADDPDVAPFEAFRSTAGAPEVTWIVGEITVPDGVDGTGRFVTFVGEGLDPLDDDPSDDGDGITNAEFACSMLDTWADGADPDALGDSYVEIYENACGGQTLQVLAPGGQTTRYVLVYEGELPEFERLMAGLATELEPA